MALARATPRVVSARPAPGVAAAPRAQPAQPLRQRLAPVRAIEIDWSDPDTQIAMAGMVLGLVAGLGAPIWYINRAEKDEERLEEIRALNRATFSQTGEYMSEVSPGRSAGASGAQRPLEGRLWLGRPQAGEGQLCHPTAPNHPLGPPCNAIIAHRTDQRRQGAVQPACCLHSAAIVGLGLSGTCAALEW
jgi:hypothetical protein